MRVHPHEWGYHTYKRGPKELSHPLCQVKLQREINCLQTRKQALIRHWIWQHLDLELPSLQHHEKYISVFYKPPVYGILIAVQVDQYTHHGGSAPTTSSKPNNLPKPPPPNIITWEMRALTYEFRRDTNLQSIAPVIYVPITLEVSPFLEFTIFFHISKYHSFHVESFSNRQTTLPPSISSSNTTLMVQCRWASGEH